MRDMNIVDVTFDYETLGRGANAAPMQLAAVAWDRNNAGNHPFSGEAFNEGFDVRSCMMAGFDIDPETVDWWRRQDDAAKEAILKTQATTYNEVLDDFFNWLACVKYHAKADVVILWAQGTDFDAAMLKNQCRKADIDIDKIIDYQHFADARSFVLQNLEVMNPGTVDMTNPKSMYRLLPSFETLNKDCLPESLRNAKCQHDALYDCMRSSWNVWKTMWLIRGGGLTCKRETNE